MVQSAILLIKYQYLVQFEGILRLFTLVLVEFAKNVTKGYKSYLD